MRWQSLAGYKHGSVSERTDVAIQYFFLFLSDKRKYMRYEFEPEKTSEKELSLSPVGEEQIGAGLSASAIKHSDLFVS